jgi:flagellin
MGLRISTNVPSLSAQRVLSVQQKRMEHASQALASGSRIVTAADDAAGLAISENMRSQIRGLAAARNNAFNASSAIQVAEGALNESTNILIRLKELSIQSASDNIGDKEREYLNTESKQLLQEMDRIAKTTRFGDKYLLDGSGGEMEFQVGTYAGEENIVKYNTNANGTTSELGVSGMDLSDKGSARDALEEIDQAIDKVSALRAGFGAVQSRLQITTSNLDTQSESMSAANSRIRDADVAKETSEMTSANILQQNAISVLAQANQFPAVALKLVG